MKRLPTLFFLLFLVAWANAQDPHLTQFYTAPLQLNPALTGVMNGNYRAGFLYRSQWGEVLRDESTSQFRTMTAASDLRIPLKRNALGIGLEMMNDKAAASNFGTTRVGMAINYMQNVDQYGRHYIALGLQADMIQRSFSLDNLRFGNQWNGIDYDPTRIQDNPAYLAQLNQNYTFFDASAGILYYMRGKNKRTTAYGGFSAQHVNQPNQSLGLEEAKLPIKFSVHSGVNFMVAKKFDLLPKFLFQFQGQSKEILFGTDVRYIFDDRAPSGNSFRFGALYRLVGGLTAKNTDGLNSESIALLTGINFHGLDIGIAYDINVSQFTSGTFSRGGFEVGLTYVGGWEKRTNTMTACPNF
ncbi:MAG: type IX secretion system PorP/SprF family membrane protein [Chitinophagales bacterium]|jgi:type IX secretion system PorP/SprF family membrane protein